MEGNIGKDKRKSKEEKEKEKIKKLIELAKEKEIVHEILDSMNDLMAISFFKDDFEKAKEIIKKSELKKLENLSKIFSMEEIEKACPGVCAKLNGFLDDMKKSDLTEVEFEEILKRIYSLKDELNKKETKVLEEMDNFK